MGIVSERGQRVRRGAATFLVATSIVVGLAVPSLAEVRRVEAVGIYGIEASARRRVIPRDEAIARATWESVSRVALELIGESPPPVQDRRDRPSDGEAVEPPFESGQSTDPRDRDDPRLAAGRDADGDGTALARLEDALGEQMLPYTRSYRILEDRGEMPVLFADDPDVESEYVVVVEVLVDVDRVAKALERSGLIARTKAQGEAAELTLEVIGLTRYPAVDRLIAFLRGPLAASRVDTLEFSRDRQVLGLEGRFGLEELAMRLSNATDPSLVLEPLAIDADRRRIRLRARYRPQALEKP